MPQRLTGRQNPDTWSSPNGEKYSISSVQDIPCKIVMGNHRQSTRTDVDSWTTSDVSSNIWRGGRSGFSIRSSKVKNAVVAKSKHGWRTDVSAGFILPASTRSSNPASMTSSGMRTLSFASVLESFKAAISFEQTIASGCYCANPTPQGSVPWFSRPPIKLFSVPIPIIPNWSPTTPSGIHPES